MKYINLKLEQNFNPLRLRLFCQRSLSTVNLAHEKVEGSLDDQPIVVCHGLL